MLVTLAYGNCLIDSEDTVCVENRGRVRHLENEPNISPLPDAGLGRTAHRFHQSIAAA